MATLISGPKGILQTAGTRDTSTVAHYRAHRWTPGSLLRCLRSQHLTSGHIRPLEGDILFSDTNIDLDMSFMHNDFTPSNCIVDNNKVVGLLIGKWLASLAGRRLVKSTVGSEHLKGSILLMLT